MTIPSEAAKPAKAAKPPADELEGRFTPGSRAYHREASRRSQARKNGDDEVLAELETARMSVWLRKQLEKAPPLTAEQRAQLARVLFLAGPGQ